MGSSNNKRSKILGMSPRRVERLLVDWVNLPDRIGVLPRPGPIERMLTLYPDVFEQWQDLLKPARKETPRRQKSDKHGELVMYLAEVRNGLRQAWNAPNSRHRDWYIFIMRLIAHQARIAVENIPKPDHEKLSPRWRGVPDGTPFESIMVYFQETIGDLAKHCANPDCPAPYFIARKRWQKFCSEACAGPANRESKRKWWREHHGNGG